MVGMLTAVREDKEIFMKREKKLLLIMMAVILVSGLLTGNVCAATVGPSFPIIAKMGKLFDTGVDYYLYDTVDYVSDRMIKADISEALVNCDTNTRMYCRELIRRTVAYSELLTKGTGGKKP